MTRLAARKAETMRRWREVLRTALGSVRFGDISDEDWEHLLDPDVPRDETYWNRLIKYAPDDQRAALSDRVQALGIQL